MPSSKTFNKSKPAESKAEPKSAIPALTLVPKAAASIISSDLKIIGSVETEGEVEIDGVVEGNVRGHLLTLGKDARINGEVSGHDVVVNGYVKGKVRGEKVRLTATAKVEGDIIHKEVSIESGAHFEGSMHREDDPLNKEAAGAKGEKSSEKGKQGQVSNEAD